jgi:hypothetical protein
MLELSKEQLEELCELMKRVIPDVSKLSNGAFVVDNLFATHLGAAKSLGDARTAYEELLPALVEAANLTEGIIQGMHNYFRLIIDNFAWIDEQLARLQDGVHINQPKLGAGP